MILREATTMSRLLVQTVVVLGVMATPAAPLEHPCLEAVDERTEACVDSREITIEVRNVCEATRRFSASVVTRTESPLAPPSSRHPGWFTVHEDISQAEAFPKKTRVQEVAPGKTALLRWDTGSRTGGPEIEAGEYGIAALILDDDHRPIDSALIATLVLRPCGTGGEPID